MYWKKLKIVLELRYDESLHFYVCWNVNGLVGRWTIAFCCCCCCFAMKFPTYRVNPRSIRYLLEKLSCFHKFRNRNLLIGLFELVFLFSQNIRLFDKFYGANHIQMFYSLLFFHDFLKWERIYGLACVWRIWQYCRYICFILLILGMNMWSISW